MKITITSLPSQYWHARGEGPCNWAQWPMSEALRDEHFFGEAGDKFRKALKEKLKLLEVLDYHENGEYREFGRVLHAREAAKKAK